MRKSRKNDLRLPALSRVLPDFLEIPESAYKDVCQIEIISNTTVTIEGCGQILSYDENIVSMKAGDKILLVEGEQLCLKGMNHTGVMIRGIIDAVRYM